MRAEERVLKLLRLAARPMYILDIADITRTRSSAYVALGRLEDKGLVRSEWIQAPSGQRRRAYEATTDTTKTGR